MTGCISALVCVLIFPSSATTRLQNSISRSLKSFSTLLDLLTSTFLLEKAIIRESKSTLKDAVSNHTSAFKTLKTDLAEAKHERIFDSRIRGNKLKLYDAAIGSLARLAQHLNGLRSSTRLQEDLIRAAREGSRSMSVSLLGGFSPGFSPVAASVTTANEGDEEMSASIRLLTRFRHLAGTQLDDLVVSSPSPTDWAEADQKDKCDDALEAVQSLSTSGQVDLPGLRGALESSLRDFNDSATRAIKRLYAGPKREKGMYHDHGHDSDSDSGSGSGSDSDEGTKNLDESTGPNETVFLVYL
jgi:hypothetical protein